MVPPLTVQETLQKKKIRLFSGKEFRRLFQLDFKKTKYFLETYTKRGLLIRLKKGMYALKNNLPREEMIANILYRPSYISFEYALAHHGILAEMVYHVTSATTKPTREFDINGKVFLYHTIKKSAFTGYVPLSDKDGAILMAEPEKALADLLYFVSLGKKSFPERLNLRRINKRKVKKYLGLFERPSLSSLSNKLFL